MSLLAAMSAAVFAYLLVGFLTGNAPHLQWRLQKPDEVSRQQLWLVQAGIQISPAQFWFWSFVVAAAGFVLGFAVTGTAWVAVPPALAMALLPRWYFARRRIQRLSEVQEAWPDGLRHLVASVRSGMSLSLALDDLAANGPEPLREAFERYPTLARVFGVGPALEIVRDELADPTTDRVVEVLLLAYERGGPLVPAILRDLAEATTADVRTLEEIRTNSLEQRINARIVFVVPWMVLLLLTARPGDYRDFYRSSAGLVVVIIAAIMSLVGTWVVARLGRDPVEERVFGGSARSVRS